MTLALPVIFCLASGFLLVSLGWSRRNPISTDYLFRVSLSIGFGLGMFSVIFFLALLLGITHLLPVDAAVFALLLIGAFLLRTRATVEIPERSNSPRSHDQPAWLRRVLATGFALALCAGLYSAVMRTLAYPHGEGWDAFAIWNLHARFLFRGGVNWRDGFTPLLPWSHPDYPLLLPAAIAHFWGYVGHDDPMVPAIIGFLFTFSTVGLLYAALSLFRGRTAALLGATALLATPSFMEQGTSQYADVPLSFFILGTVALICLYDAPEDSSQSTPGLLVLAGFAAACAAWTKNEGLLFLCAIVVARLLTLMRSKGSLDRPAAIRQFAPLLVAIVPALLLIASFKHFIAPPGDLFSDPTTTLHKLLDPARYWAIIRWYFKGFFRFGRWLLIPGTLALIAFYFAAGKEDYPQPRSGVRTSALALSLTLAGYFAVYLITPYNIYWHLRFSLTRLFLQLWPSAIFLFFLVVKSGSIAGNQAPSSLSKTGLNVSK